MGFLRKLTIISTGGMAPVKAESYKERTAKATEHLARGAAPPRALSQVSPVVRLGSQEGWLNEVASTLADLGLIAIARNTGSQLCGIPIEADLVVVARNFIGGQSSRRTVLTLFATAAEARQAECGLTARPTVRTDISRGRCVVRAVDRLLYVARAGEKRVDVSRLDSIVSAVGDIGLPPAVPPSSAVPATNTTTADEIERLVKLHADGTLSDDEFVAAKSKALGT